MLFDDSIAQVKLPRHRETSLSWASSIGALARLEGLSIAARIVNFKVVRRAKNPRPVYGEKCQTWIAEDIQSVLVISWLKVSVGDYGQKK
jgi:hypothetical protein